MIWESLTQNHSMIVQKVSISPLYLYDTLSLGLAGKIHWPKVGDSWAVKEDSPIRGQGKSCNLGTGCHSGELCVISDELTHLSLCQCYCFVAFKEVVNPSSSSRVTVNTSEPTPWQPQRHARYLDNGEEDEVPGNGDESHCSEQGKILDEDKDEAPHTYMED